MCPHVPFQLISVSAGIAAQTALEGSLSCVRADVPFQLTDLKQGDKTKKRYAKWALSHLENTLKKSTSDHLPPHWNSHTLST